MVDAGARDCEPLDRDYFAGDRPRVMAEVGPVCGRGDKRDTGLHADQAQEHVGKAALDLAARSLPAQRDAAGICHDLEGVLPMSIPTMALPG